MDEDKEIYGPKTAAANCAHELNSYKQDNFSLTPAFASEHIAKRVVAL